jgi:hypothetical protein
MASKMKTDKENKNKDVKGLQDLLKSIRTKNGYKAKSSHSILGTINEVTQENIKLSR